MPATRPLMSFTVTNTKGETITVQRRCFGTGVEVQKQLSAKVYNETTKKFESPAMPSKKEQVKIDKRAAKAAAEINAAAQG